MISLFEQYRIPVTWAIVGHLLDYNWNYGNNISHKEYLRPIYKNEQNDWFANKPKKGEEKLPIWFDSNNYIDTIKKSKVGHEIASHSYAHIKYNINISEANVKIDVNNSKKIHNKYNLEFKSFVFPYNLEGHHNVLKNTETRERRQLKCEFSSAVP